MHPVASKSSVSLSMCCIASPKHLKANGRRLNVLQDHTRSDRLREREDVSVRLQELNCLTVAWLKPLSLTQAVPLR